MQGDTTPIVKDLVLIGGGHSHVIVLRRLGMKPMPGVRVTLIGRDVDTPYSGMLPGFVAGHYSHDDIHIDLGPLTRFAGARFYHDEVVGLDLDARLVFCRQRPPVPYDVLSIDIGSTPHMHDVPGAGEHALPVKPISRFVDRWQALRERVLGGEADLDIGVVGAGAGGIELLLAMRHGLHGALAAAGRDARGLRFHLFAAGQALLPASPPGVQRRFERILAARGVQVHRDARVTGVESGRLMTGSGETHAVDEVLWVTQAGTQSWPAEAGLATDAGGFIAVRPTLESTSHAGVFAAGDCAAVLEHPREKAGVFAVRQGPPLEDNLRRALTGRPRRPFTPQRRFLALISSGGRHAVATRGGGLSVEGAWVWRWKDWIDRRFMRRFSELPDMPGAEAPRVAEGLADAEAIQMLTSHAMRCGGCGAKDGASVLSRVLGELRPASRTDVLIGLDAPDDAAVVAVPPGKHLVQTVDGFRALLDDPYSFGRVAANHCLGDVFAMGAEPHTALAIVTLPHGLEAKTEATLRELLRGALQVLEAAGATLVGGHTSEGAELYLGFALNGLVDADALLRKGGARPGDALLLTRGLGTGTLFAAHMRGRARGAWISAALDDMVRSNADAAACLREHGARACTDVTGFGLIGHLLEMLRGSSVGAELDIDAVPLLDGALHCVEAGITSSLQADNVRLRRALDDGPGSQAAPDPAAADARIALLFDPQTAGGLLAALPPGHAEACVAALRRLGHVRSAVIGRVVEATDPQRPIRLCAGPPGR